MIRLTGIRFYARINSYLRISGYIGNISCQQIFTDFDLDCNFEIQLQQNIRPRNYYYHLTCSRFVFEIKLNGKKEEQKIVIK